MHAGADCGDRIPFLLLDRQSTIYSWLLSDARTPVWFSRWHLSGQGVVSKGSGWKTLHNRNTKTLVILRSL